MSSQPDNSSQGSHRPKLYQIDTGGSATGTCTDSQCEWYHPQATDLCGHPDCRSDAAEEAVWQDWQKLGIPTVRRSPTIAHLVTPVTSNNAHTESRK